MAVRRLLIDLSYGRPSRMQRELPILHRCTISYPHHFYSVHWHSPYSSSGRHGDGRKPSCQPLSKVIPPECHQGEEGSTGRPLKRSRKRKEEQRYRQNRGYRTPCFPFSFSLKGVIRSADPPDRIRRSRCGGPSSLRVNASGGESSESWW